MNPNRYQGRGGGPTGSIRRTGGSGGPPLAGHSDKKWGDTTSKAGEVSRVFVGNIDYKATNCSDIEQRFSKYGPIKGIDINNNGFAFVQYERVEDAQNACQNENGLVFNNRKSEVRLFDKSNHPVKGRARHSSRDRSRSPLPRGPTGGPTGTRHGTVVPNMTQFDDHYGYPPPPQPIVGNDAEIIVINKEQWGYAELIERRIRREIGIEHVDMLFLHSPSSLNLTLNDLYERQTLYAIVVSPVNEEHKSLTLHVLHNQTEHRNMPLEDAFLLIARDFQAFSGRNGRAPVPPIPPQAIPTHSGDNPYNPYNDNYNRTGINDPLKEPTKRMDNDVKLPEEVSYLLKTVIQEDGPQFLSLPQIDTIIDYFTRERTRLAARAPTFQPSASGPSQQQQQGLQQNDFEKQRATLLDNPHVQAALSSLLQIGALNNSMKSESDLNVSNSGQYGAQQPNNNMSIAPTRRHPLLGTELGPNKTQTTIPGAPGGLVRYPPPQNYSQYSFNS